MTTAKITTDLFDFFVSQKVASVGQKAWLLAYCLDAVCWGRIENGQLILAAGQTLNAAKIQTAHLFGDDAEIRIWRSGDDLVYCELCDIGSDDNQIDEYYQLWGTQGKLLENKFTELSDGVQGLRHTVPIAVKFPAGKNRSRPLSLHVRHYIGYERDQAYITHSRLVNLVVKPQI